MKLNCMLPTSSFCFFLNLGNFFSCCCSGNNELERGMNKRDTLSKTYLLLMVKQGIFMRISFLHKSFPTSSIHFYSRQKKLWEAWHFRDRWRRSVYQMYSFTHEKGYTFRFAIWFIVKGKETEARLQKCYVYEMTLLEKRERSYNFQRRDHKLCNLSSLLVLFVVLQLHPIHFTIKN